MNWNSIDLQDVDTLPKDNSDVLAFVNGEIKILFYAVSYDDDDYSHWWSDEHGEYCYDIDSGDVTHWMPLPQPPTRRMAVLTVPHYNS